jgi:biopolymer transport protein ExbD
MAFAPSAARRGGKDKGASSEDHLIPVMNLMIILIPFLLQAAVFVTTVAIQVTLPPQAAGGGGDGGAGSQQKILMVGMSAQNGFLVTNDRGTLPWIGLTPDGDYDYEELRRVLRDKVKTMDVYKDHDEVILAVQDTIPFTAVIDLMDAVRGNLVKVEIKTEEDAAKYGVDLKPGQVQNVWVAELFPNIIFGGAAPQ